MKGTGVGATPDVIVRDLLSSLTALAALFAPEPVAEPAKELVGV